MPRRQLLWLALLLLPIAQAAASPLAAPEGPPLLKVSGNISQTNKADAAHLDRAMLEALPRHELETSTSVTDGVNRFEGFLMRDLLEKLGAEGETAAAIALNDYLIEIPIADFHDYDVLVADTMDGEALTPRDKG
ncbi:hypothetical protein ACFFUA_38200, partial [Streptomyces heliomycini]